MLNNDTVTPRCRQTKGIPREILELLKDLYSNTLNSIRVHGELSSRVHGELSPWFDLSAGVRQGGVLAPGLFLEPMD